MQPNEPIPYGSDVSAGTFECADCGERIQIGSAKSLPPCSNNGDGRHHTKAWSAVSGRGDAADDPESARH